MPPTAARSAAPRLERRELANQELPLDLQPDEKEEERHQAVVDPVAKGKLEPKALASRDRERARPESVDDVGPSATARPSASTVVPMSTMPPAVVRRRNCSKGETMRPKSASSG